MSQKLIIESIIKRAMGTTVKLDENDYDFLPSEEHGGAHVCEVTDPDHIAIFLAIKEGYRVYGSKSQPQKNDDNSTGEDGPFGENLDSFDLEDVEKWSNRKLNLYAKSLGINAKSKVHIGKVALEQYDLELPVDESIACPKLIRMLAIAIRDGDEADLEGGEGEDPTITTDDPTKKEDPTKTGTQDPAKTVDPAKTTKDSGNKNDPAKSNSTKK